MAAPLKTASELCVLYGEALGAYSFGEDHPFGPARLSAFWDEFNRRGLGTRVAVEAPETCTEKELLTFHSPDYIRFVQQSSLTGIGYLDAGDTPSFQGVFQAASRVVGTTLKAMRLVMDGRYKRAFCPMGGLHHAQRSKAGGFCVFNDIGVAIEHARLEYGLQRVGYVDIDAHHGDGVFYEYEANPNILIADIHEHGQYLYPGTGFKHETGTGAAAGTKLNIALKPGAGVDEFMAAFRDVEDFLDERRPEIIFLQCGADSLEGDPLAHLKFSPRCHAHAAQRLWSLANKHAQGRLIAMGGGGYSLENIAQAWTGVVEALLK